MEYTSKARKLLKKHGNEKVKQIFLIKTFHNKILKYGSLVVFNRKYKHITPFHIEFKLVTENGTTLFLEKSLQIKLNYCKTVPIGKEVELTAYKCTNPNTLNHFLKNTKKYMGKRFGKYRVLNNCQHFVDAFLKANHLTAPPEEEVKQELEHFLEGFWCAFFVKTVDLLFLVLDFFIMLYFLIFNWIIPCILPKTAPFLDTRTLYLSSKSLSNAFSNVFSNAFSNAFTNYLAK
jgi:hypothetical protein